MLLQVERAIAGIKSILMSQGINVNVLGVTDLGVVNVRLSGDNCSGRLKRLLTILDIEQILKQSVPEVKIVIEASEVN